MEMAAKSQYKGTREWMKGDEDLLSFQQRVLAADNDAQTEADVISNAVRRGSPAADKDVQTEANIGQEEAVNSTAAVQQDRLGLSEHLAASDTISGQVAEGCKAEDQISSMIDNETASRRFCQTIEASKNACARRSRVRASYIPADMRANKYVLVVCLGATHVS